MNLGLGFKSKEDVVNLMNSMSEKVFSINLIHHPEKTLILLNL
jgi:hypothetical protein